LRERAAKQIPHEGTVVEDAEAWRKSLVRREGAGVRTAVFGLVLVFASATVAQDADARDWPRTAGWDVFEYADDCAIHLEYEGKGSTELSLFLEVNGDALLVVGNEKWSIEKGEKTDLIFGVNGRVYSDGVAVGVSDKYASKKSFATKFGPEFLRDFAASPNLVILKGDVLVDRLSLGGSGAAIAMAKRCLTKVRADIAAADAERRRYADIADDPFAKPGGEPSPAGLPIKGGPKGNPGSWFTDDDYPADAKRAGAQGSVSLLLSVDTAGKVVGCRVTASSGNASLDDATCRLAQRRGRFTVQKDAEGNAQPYTYSLPGIHWSIKGE